MTTQDSAQKAMELSEQGIELLTTYATEYGFKVLAAILIFFIGKMIAGIGCMLSSLNVQTAV